MRKLRTSKVRLWAALGMSALVSLGTLLEKAKAQVPPDCLQGGLASVITVSPTVGHVGDTIAITQVGVTLGGTACDITNGQSFVMYPNGLVGSVQQYQTDFTILQGDTLTCLPVPSSPAATCQAVTLTYVVLASDINIPLSFTTPRAFSSGSVPATAGQVKFLVVSDGLLAGSGGTLTAGGQGNAAVRIVNPRISVTKECVVNCPPTNAARFGEPINFRGRVCNIGDITLTGVTVSDNPPATITFETTTSLGNAFPAGGGGILRSNECVNYSGSYQPAGTGAQLCGPFIDTIIASGTDTSAVPGFQARTVFATNSAVCTVCTTPRIDVTKICLDPVVPAGNPARYVVTVQNTGDVPLQNVVLVDDSATPGNPGDDVTINVGNLGIGQSAGPFTNSIPTSVADCAGGGLRTNTVVATGANICNPAQTVSDTDRCNFRVICQPRICIVKQVACAPSSGLCDSSLTYAELATGVANSADPAFCYKITVSNCGEELLNNVTVSDPDIPSVAGAFPTSLAVGQTETRFFKKTWDVGTHVNVATANGIGAGSLVRVTTNDNATVIVLRINIECELTLNSSFDMDGNPSDNHVTLPVGSVNTPITFNLTLRNTGNSPLNVTSVSGLPSLVDCTDLTTPVQLALPVNIPGGGSVAFSACVIVSCPGTSFSVTAHAEADDQGGTLCVFDSQGNRIADDTTPCTANVTCDQAVTCRVTGGGVLIPGTSDESCITVNTTIFPFTSPNGLTIKKITHGGQLGAPFSQMDCGEILGNPCIRGQWSHIRHYEGTANPRDVIDMDFHSQTPKGVYDSLNCACLGCCDPLTGVFITPITIGSICNPDDHKVCGPQPRPAPANAIIWSGIGKVTPVDDFRGSRAAQAEWVIFRVYIEDRSEPGGFHPNGAVQPSDIYCFQAWKTGIKVSKKPDFSTIATTFRSALGQANCDFLRDLLSGALPIGSLPSPTVNGMTADIQDCGPLHDGNHQIHPATGATCDQ